MRRALLGLVLLGSCDLVSKVQPPKIKIPPIPSLNNALSLPKTVDGKYLLMELDQARLEVDPTLRDPLTALGDCADQVSYCYAPGVRELDDCVRSVRSCTTDQPWLEPVSCCPKQCQDDYATARGAGIDAPSALDKVFFVDHQCFPGVTAELAGTR